MLKKKKKRLGSSMKVKDKEKHEETINLSQG